MKKLFIAALALTAFTACSQDELVEQQQHPSGAIAFSGAFVDNATRAAQDPSTTAASINAFNVWAHIQENNNIGVVFNNLSVTKNATSGAWEYSPLEYWIPGNTYYFAALSPKLDNNYEVAPSTDATTAALGLGTVTFTNVDGTYDLIYAKDMVDAPKAGSDKTVSLLFNHLLSKVKFTFKNGFTNPNNKLVVKNIKMLVPSKGEINLATSAWSNDENASTWNLITEGTTPATLEFGHVKEGAPIGNEKEGESDCERLTIPAAGTQEYVVTFDVELWYDNVMAYERSLSSTISDVQFRIGHAYNIKATLDQSNIAEDNLKPILFTVEDTDDNFVWTDGNDYNEGSISTTIVSVGSVEELEAAVADGATNFKITNNLEITNPLTFGQTVTGRSATEKEYVLDLNGMIIENKTGDAIVAQGEGVKLTINGNENSFIKAATSTEAVPTSGNAVWAHGGATVIINGGNYFVGSDQYSTSSSKRNDCIYAGKQADRSAGYIYIYGGNFSVEEDNYNNENGQYWVLNLKDGTDSEIKVYGGTFKSFDPSVNKSENPAFDFVAPGYGVEENNGVYTVKALPAVSIDVAAGATQKLTSNVIINGSAKVAGTFDGDGKTLYAAAEPTNDGLIRPSGTAVVKNVTIDGANRRTTKDKALRGIYATSKLENLTIENVNTTGTGYALNLQSKTVVSLTVKNSTFEGWTSYASAITANFEKVTFTRGNYFSNADNNGYFRPYGNTTLKDCEFELGFIVDFSEFKNSETITFKNCTYNGVKLTADNIPTAWVNYNKDNVIFE